MTAVYSEALAGDELELVLPPEPESVVEARAAVADVARRLGAREEDVRLAVSEAVGNAVIHAFRDGGPGTITVHARFDAGRLLVTVSDDGIGMTPNPDSPGLGFGIALIGKLADDVRFSSSGEGTVISMCFNAAALSPTADAEEQGKEG
jgi:anti-sigma regulatory factor (Ser/Thr protein kinase)